VNLVREGFRSPSTCVSQSWSSWRCAVSPRTRSSLVGRRVRRQGHQLSPAAPQASATRALTVIPFGPSTPMAQIRGAGSRTLTDTDHAWIDELLWLNGCNGVGLSLDDISVALRRERGVDVSAATLSRTFAYAAP
jgi:hypothetical protein